ncbi:MAG: GAF domain-containing protein, partial [Holophagae bacterium]|nr:GAF domain-containing protein [Holophagae bacterium]
MGIHKNLLNILWFGEVPRRYARYVGSAQTDLAALTLFSHDIVIFTDIFYLGHQSEIKGIIPVDDYYVHIRRRSGQDISGCMTFSSEKEFRLVLFIEKKLMKLKESERILSQNYEVLNHITTSAINLSDPDIIMREFMNKVQALLNTRSWSLLLLNRERDALYFRMTNRNVKKKLSQIKIPVGKGVAGWVASTREAIIINDVTKDARFLNEVDEAIGFETKRIMAAPLVGKGELFGVIELINKDGEKPFTEDDLESLKTMVKYGSIILHNALIFSEMEEMTKRDDLTALFNSRYQNWFLEESIRKATQ